MNTRWIDTLVGLALIGAIAFVVFSQGWLKRSWEERNSVDFAVTFDDARGLKGAEEVRMAGFQIGAVKDVRLSEPDYRRAMVTLRVNRRYPIPRDSKVAVQTSPLGGTPFITIVPGRTEAGLVQEGDTVQGAPGAGLDSLLSSASQLVNDQRMQTDLKATLHAVRQTSESVARLLGDPRMQRDMRATVANVRQASEALPPALQQATALVPTLQKQLLALSGQSEKILANLETTTRTGARAAQQAEGLTADLRSTVNENRKAIQTLLRSANDAASGVAALTQQVAEMAGDKDIKKNLIAVTENLSATTRSFVTIAQRLDSTALNVQALTGDPKLALDFKATVANLKETTDSVKNLAARIEALRLPGEKRPGPSPTPRPVSQTSLLEPGLTFDSVYDTTGERYRLDAHYSLLTGNRGGFYRLGLMDASERNLLSLQWGQSRGLPAGGALRYGLVAGKLGVGGDLRVGPLDLRLDLFDPNRLTASLRAKTYVNPSTALTVGVEAIGRREKRATVGIQLRR